MVDVRPPLSDWLVAAAPAERRVFRRWRAGEGSILERFEPGVVSDETLELARTAGITAYAAIPIRVDDELAGGIVAYFDRSPDELHVNHAALDSVARIVGDLAGQLPPSRAVRGLRGALPDAVRGVTRRLPPVRPPTARSSRPTGPPRRLYGGPLVGLDVGAFLDVDRGAADRWRAMVERGEPLHSAGTARRADGTRFPRETEASPVRIDDEDRYLVVVRDLTERQRLQTELVQAQKMETVGILVSGVAHELNNPIASIIGLSTLIGRDPGLSPDLRESAGLLVDEAQRAGQIVRTFLDFVRSRPPERHPTADPATARDRPRAPVLLPEERHRLGHRGRDGAARGSRSTARRSSRSCST